MLTLNLGPSGGYSGGGDKQREGDKLDTCGPRPEGGRRKPAALRLWPAAGVLPAAFVLVSHVFLLSS